ncbi:putative wrky transcription factor 69 [Quercus suber]|uniref:Wrky transcription factor 69 n=1 Tax=Quercus suber TaxID=58331 RepID=A0AAW0KPU9_QUESU
MNRRFHTNPFVTDPDEPEAENGLDSPSSGDDTKISSAPSPKKSKRDLKKRVVSVPIGDVEGSKSKGEAYPPSDSWAWRKYGQKPIKGSPYPSEDPSSSSPPLLDDHFEWYSDVATAKILESPVSAGSMCTEADVAMVFAMGEEEESLFADLGELPECSLVFRSRRSVVKIEPDNNNNNNNNVESNRTSWGSSVLPCCGTTG